MSETSESMPEMQANPSTDPLDELPVAYVEMNVRGAITRANRMTRALHSSHAGELIGKLAWELMPTEEQDRSYAVFMTAIETGVNPPVARRSLYDSSGNFRVYDLYRNLIRDPQGKPVGMRVVSVDVTEAHKAHSEADQARQWLESVMESLSDAVIVTDALGFIRTVNPAAEKLLGWTSEELIGSEVESALPVLASVSGGKSQISFSMALESSALVVATLHDREQRELLVEIGSSPIIDKKTGCTAGVVSVLRRVDEAA